MSATYHRVPISAAFGVLCMVATGQNLVVNGTFETYSALPSTYAQICLASGWSSPTNSCVLVVGCGSPEYYHTSAAGGVQPPNTFWATVMPHAGAGMAGFAPWYFTSPGFREYMRTTLSAPLTVGQTYEVGFWLTNGVSTIHPFGVNHIGVAFSAAPLTQSCGAQIAYTPQVEIASVFFSTTWQYVSLTFTATQAFQYMCIGNFVPYASTTSQNFGGPGSSGSYYYIDDVSVKPAVVLPIELISFNARAMGRDALLEWTTATEIDNDRFEVERSTDGIAWSTVRTVPGTGNSLVPIAYELLDPSPPAGTDYYRLRQVDFDGAARYSGIVSVTFDATGLPMVWPQPCDGAFTLRMDPGERLSITDLLGQAVAFTSRPLAEDAVEVSILRPATGPYLVRSLDGAWRTTVIVR